MASEFLYVLINPSMPGLAKVGKTTRDPTHRVNELSGATGIPSPFILAYQQPVADCNAAERWVHVELERRGFRFAKNREFFDAPLHEIVSVVSAAAEVGENSSATAFISAINVGGNDRSKLAEQLYEQGMEYIDGTGGVIKNWKKGLDLVEQAAALDDAGSCAMAGALNRWGHDEKYVNLEKSVYWFRRAVSLGQWWNLADLAQIFLGNSQVETADKLWKEFFEEAVRTSGDRMFANSGAADYCERVASGEQADVVDHRHIGTLKDAILAGLDSAQARTSKLFAFDPWWITVKTERLTSAREFVQRVTAP